jgi:NTE family protein
MRAAKPTLREWLADGRFSLGLSSGFFGFFAHAGVLTVLEDEGLLPARVAGSSAGALVAGAWAAGIDGPRLSDELARLRREDFWDPAPGLGLLRGERFRRLLEALLPAQSFEACRVPLSVSVFDVLSSRTRVLDRGPLAAAVQASCTVPLLFHPRWLDGRPVLDGGIADRAGIAGLGGGERILHHHLASRSPWRAQGSASLEVPRRTDLCALVVKGLPRVGPFRLGQGRIAFDLARAAARRALSEPVTDGAVSIGAAQPTSSWDSARCRG